MRKLGIIGGTSWNSTALYYRHINEGIARALGGLHSARLMVESIDLAPYAADQRAGRTAAAEARIVAAGEALAAGGAQAILIASNTTNRYAPAVAAATGLPLLHIADPTIAQLRADGRRRIALFGTRYVMTEGFARDRYAAAGLEVMRLREDWIEEIDRIIFDELAMGQVKRSSQRALKTMITELDKQRADAIVLGCTELCLAVDSRANVMPVYDTTQLHARAAVDWLLEDEETASAAA
ncbi:aspartate/glutamate racemase family protein [Sphingomicrobium astaxanthinifaciens]|uniref:aspartate/glutamate racemase family protein n=1 Tax=Sphingomicrobium astaxanthinifaciens TaxID=1227949 RepID=UPI001FCB036F|nr:amino acid racemase [Sphingomicrobium astaxanthinifaciens]MCJ7420323.1 amino acid racemase [Sphingomicrobium astaxanthinifaciens]